jgi:hypothetical protein
MDHMSTPPAGPPRTIYLIRHGEKPDPHSPDPATGVEIDGEHNSHSLTPRGWQRSGALAILFTRPPRPGDSALTVPDRLICPDYGDRSDAAIHRPHQTLLGLSGMTSQPIETPYHETHEAELAAAVLADNAQTVLICWEHGRIPAIAAAIPTTTPVPTSWPDHRFDLIWQFTLADQATRTYTFRQLPQNALRGDAAP